MVDLKKIKEEAIKLNEKGEIGSFVFKSNFALYRKKGTEIVRYAYKCQNCGFEEEKEEEMEFPYKIKCPNCRKLVFKSRKPSGRRKK